MPQLSFETFVSQYFWLVLTLFALYYIMINKLLPLISESYKARSNIDNSVIGIVEKDLVKESLLIKDIASLQFTPSLYSTSHSSVFSKNFLSWSNKLN